MTVCFAKLCFISSANVGLRDLCITGFRIHMIQSTRVALQACQFRTLHRTTAITCGVTLRRELKNLRKLRINISLARLETRFARRLLKPVPRANILADVATIYPAG